MKKKLIYCFLLFVLVQNTFSTNLAKKIKKEPQKSTETKTWTSDNGNGTFTNPLFFDEFSDPDMIRVGDDYYLTGTTMHAMPGLPVLHSKDLVNWEFMSYAVNRLDFGPEYRLENGKSRYGQGIWAPSFRYHNGVFHIFTNVNGRKTQLFTATNPKGPWKHQEMKVSLHDLSVLFDDDGKVYAVWGYDELKMAELNETLTDLKPGTERIVIPKSSGAGEGCHWYKIDGKYYITITNYEPLCYQVCARADHPYGPYEITVISAKESMGNGTGWRLSGANRQNPFELVPPKANYVGSTTIHQGGVVQTQTGEWWAFSMDDHNSIGRLLNLSPLTWKNGWPYLGLEGNLTRSPRTWVKPNTGFTSTPHAPYERSDDFSATTLKPVWQWNHVPVDTKWSLTERKGYLRLHSLASNNFWQARNSLTQRAVGPASTPTAEFETKAMKEGDIAGLALLNYPYAWIGIAKTKTGVEIQQYDQRINKVESTKIDAKHIWLRATCDFDTEKSTFSYSTDGTNFQFIGTEMIMAYALVTFQGVRYSLFNYNVNGVEGGYVDINNFVVDEPRSKGLTQPIPYDKIITLTSLADSTVLVSWKNFVRPVSASSPLAKGVAAQFKVLDRGNGRIALQSLVDNGYVTVIGLGVMGEVRIEKKESDEASTFQWEDMMRGDLMLMSLKTHRYLFVDPQAKSLTSADSPGTRPDRRDGSCFTWKIVN